MEQPEILLVDDDDLVLRGLSRALRASCNVTTARTTEIALAAFAEGRRYDLVLLDLSMTDVSAFVAAVAAIAPEQLTRIVIHTGFPRDACPTVALRAVEDRVIEKPATAREIADEANRMRVLHACGPRVAA